MKYCLGMIIEGHPSSDALSMSKCADAHHSTCIVLYGRRVLVGGKRYKHKRLGISRGYDFQ